MHTGFDGLEGLVRRGLGPGAAQPPGGLLAFLFGQVFEHVAQFVHAAALEQGPLAEHFLDAFVQGLAAVEPRENRGLGVQPALAQVCQQFAHDGAVLGGPVPQPQPI